MHETITESNFLLYCAKHYKNPQCKDTEEFLADLRRVKYIKKLFTRYEIKDELKERLILNHIIILNNVFGPIPTVRILFFKFHKNEKFLSYLKPFLVMLNLLPPIIYNIGSTKIISTDLIPLDPNIVAILRSI